MITFIVLFILFLCLTHYLCYYNEKAKLLSKIPGSKYKFLVGNTLDILFTPVKLFSVGRHVASKYNGIYRFYAYPYAAVNIYNPDDIEKIVSMTKNYAKSEVIYNFLRPWLRDGLLISKGSKWHQRRKILTQTFHFNILEKYYIKLQENNQHLLNTLMNMDGNTVDISAMLSEYTLNVICETAMDTQLSQVSGEGKLYKEAIRGVVNLVVERFMRPYLYLDFFFNLSSIGKKQWKYLSVVHGFTKNVIDSRRKALEEDKESYKELKEITENVGLEHTSQKRKNIAMLDILILAEKEGLIDHEGIQEEVDTFMVAGQDTVSAALIYCLLLLANNPKAQDKVYEELKSIFGEDAKAVTINDLASMRYLECCIKESLRLYPPAPFISRKLLEDTVLSGYTVPAGTDCHIHIYDLHRLPSLYKNPLEFDPERFLPENCIRRHKFAYIPFSAGPRNCIGQKFAMMEIKSAISEILRNFKLLPVTKHSNLCLYSDMVLRNSGPILMKFIKR